MTTGVIRQKLITYLAEADESKVKALYTLLEKEIGDEAFTLTNEQFKILERERKLHLNGQSKSYSRTEANHIIKGQHSF